jgi:hypothetical protein
MPEFVVESIDEAGSHLIGRLSAIDLPGAGQLEDGDMGCLRSGSDFFWGRWSQRANSWVFAAVDGERWFTPLDLENMRAHGEQREFEVWDGYWGEKAELALDSSVGWRSRSWSDEDQRRFDHRHCYFCWRSIGNYGEKDFYGGVGQSTDAVACTQCFFAFVEPKSVDFSTIGGPAVR